MSGILDKKTKLIDLVVTTEGKRQMTQGGFTPTFASFSDKNTYYDKANTSTQDSTGSLFFQTPTAMSDDQIVYETDDSGKMVAGSPSEDFTIVGDQLFEKDATSTGVKSFVLVSGSQFASTVKLVKDATLNSFKRNRFVRTVSGFDADGKTFKLSTDNHTFVISNSVPFPMGPLTEQINLDSAETFMFDNKLAHNANFKYLPPVNEDGTYYGSYQDFRSTTKETFADIKSHLGINVMLPFESAEQENTVFNYESDFRIKNREPNLPTSTVISREFASIYFSETSEENNVIMQIFEEDSEKGKVTKLDIVDAGILHDDDDEDNYEKHVFYVGKILFDSLGLPTFVNMFTIIFD
jgi:hypothetical protein